MPSYKIFAATLLLSVAATFNAWSQSHKRIEIYVNSVKQKIGPEAIRVTPNDTVKFVMYGVDDVRKIEKIEVEGCAYNPKAADNYHYRNTTTNFPVTYEDHSLRSSFVVKDVTDCPNRRFTATFPGGDAELAKHEGYQKPFKFHLK